MLFTPINSAILIGHRNTGKEQGQQQAKMAFSAKVSFSVTVQALSVH